MKQVTIAILFFLISFQSFSQQAKVDSSNYNISQDRADYDQLRADAKHEKVTAVVLVSVGGGLAVGGAAAIIVGGFADAVDDVDGVHSHQGDDLVRTGAIVAGIGVATALVSISFFISSHHDKKEARSLKLHLNSNSCNIPVSGFKSINKPQLGIGLSIPL
jgi:hypothetical protein